MNPKYLIKIAVLACFGLWSAAYAYKPPKIGDVLHAPESSQADDDRRVVTMLITQFAYPNINYPILESTVETLKKLFGPNHFKVSVYSGETSDIGKPDLVLSSAGTYARMKMNGARDLASVVSSLAPDPNRAEGSVFIALKSRTDLRDIPDLKNKIAAMTGPNAFSGSNIALGELHKRGYNPDRFFSRHVTSDYDMQSILEILRERKADVGVVRTCFLEELQNMGRDVSDFKVIGQRASDGHLKCATSTDLYPNWTIFATPNLSSEDARKVELALLSMPPGQNNLHWGIVSDFASTDQLYKDLRLGHYKYLREWTWERIKREYGTYILIFILSVIALLIHSVRTTYLVDKRTNQLRTALQRQKETLQKAQKAQLKIQTLQKAGAVGQISSIVAHELRQPLATIMNYSHGLQRLLEQNASSDVISDVISKVQGQAEKAERIVSKVRAYAKGSGQKRKILNLGKLVTQSVSLIQESGISKNPILLNCSAKHEILIYGDPVEIELCVVNLIKNALEASPPQSPVRVSINIAAPEQNSLEPYAEFIVRDEGAKLTQEEFAKITEPLQSKKIEGLGLGLAIVQLIISNHKGSLMFKQLPEKGIEAIMRLPLVAKESQNVA